MAFLRKIPLFIVVFIFPAFSQFLIQEVGSERDSSATNTISFETDSAYEESRKNEWGAAFMSLGLPGAGQLYLGQKKRGFAFFVGDMMLLTGTIFSEATSRRKYRTSIDYARNYASSAASFDMDDPYWNIIGQYDNSETYNKDFAYQPRDFENGYYDENAWNWISDTYREDYNDQRSKASEWHSASYFFAGGLIVNRVISFVDARIQAGKYNSSLLSGLRVNTYYSVSEQSAGVMVSGVF